MKGGIWNRVMHTVMPPCIPGLEATRSYPLDRAADAQKDRETRNGIAFWIMPP